MDVAVLGSLVVAGEGGAVEIPAAKERAVVAALALAAPRPVTVAGLVDALWGDDPPRSAVKTLQNYVARLRRALPPGTIASAPDGYRLALAPEAVDAHRFERELDAARAAAAAGDHGAVADAIERARALWRGPPVPDLAAGPAGRAEAARLGELRLAADEVAADAQLALGRHEQAVPALEAAARAEPLRERRWAQLMLALYRSGRQADALRAYRRARAALVEGLGLDPGDELTDLEARIIARDPGLRAPVPTAEPPGAGAAPRASLPPAVAALASGPVVGREPELAAVEAAWAAARAGEARAVVVSGEPGIGKSRLLAEAARAAHRDGALVLFGRCDREPVVAYQPLAEAIRAWVRAAPPGALRDGLGWEAAELARLVPDLARRAGAPAPPPAAPDDGAARHRLAEAVVAFVDDRAAERPVVLAVDDAQWADAATIGLLRHLLRALPATPLLVVATHRSHDGRSDGRLAELLAGLPAEARPAEVPLHGLGPAAVAALLGEAGPDVAAAVDRAAGGSPLYVTQIADHVRATGRVPAPGEIPPGLHQAIAARLVDLPAPAGRLLVAGAVTGASFEPEVAAAAAGLGAGAAADAARAARRARLVDDDPGQPGSLAFAHDLVRATVLDDLAPSRRLALHRAVAGALVARYGDGDEAPAGRVAHHLVAAAAGGRDAGAARWSATAGRRAAGQAAWEMAADHVAAALAHLPAGGDGDGGAAGEGLPARGELLVAEGRARRAAGATSVAKARFLAAVDLAVAAGDAVAQAEAALAWAEVPVDVRRELGEVIAVLRAAGAALDAAGDTAREGAGGDRLRAQLAGRLAFSLAWAGDPAAAATADRAVALARTTGDRTTLARALVWAVPTRVPFDVPAAEMAALAPDVGEPPLRWGCRHASFVGAVQRADGAGAREALAGMQELAAARDPDIDVRLAKAVGDWALAQGQVAEAERRADDMFAVAARGDTRNAALLAGALLDAVRRAQGRLAELAGWFDAVAARGDRVALVPALHTEALVAAGRAGEARARLDAAVAGGFADVWPVEAPHTFATLAGCAAALGHRPAAEALAVRLAPWAGRIVYDGDGAILGAVDHHLALCARTLGRRRAAEAHAAVARELHASLDAPGLVALADAAG